ncbi:hypothetical protein ALC60_09493 [Trachymyrmex zeteki]|uniref:Uncharacterized protein n=1 Tax=Mycetomoellerius zeteki TaxID=64791 RepID=A0A151WUT2_9HYME|nr:hypothetical protein ALC60_09493 [Trachymyrmex zeteki]
MDNEYLNYVEQFKRTILTVVELEIKRRRTAAAAAVLRYTENKNRQYSKKQCWIAPIFEDRNKSSFYFASVPKLRLEDLRFHNYFRMSSNKLEELLQIVGAKLQKQNVVRESISPPERLALILRFV